MSEILHRNFYSENYEMTKFKIIQKPCITQAISLKV
jgi:hypothetical protein